MTFNWTSSAEAEMKRLYVDEGKSASEVAKAMGGGCTRNAVIGKAHRLGWMKEHRQKPAAVGLKAPRVRRDRSTDAIVQNIAARTPPKPGQQNRPAIAFGHIEVVNAAETENRRTAQRAQGEKIIEGFAAPANDTAIPLMERRRFQCAWPVGEPERPAQQMCCGLPVQEGVGTALESYCAAHQQRAASAYQPVRREIKAPAEYRRAAAKPAPSSIWDEARVA